MDAERQNLYYFIGFSADAWICLDVLGSIFGGEGGIRTPGTLASTSDFESGAFNRALPPLRIWFERPAIWGGVAGNWAPDMRCGCATPDPLRGYRIACRRSSDVVRGSHGEAGSCREARIAGIDMIERFS